MADMTGKIIKGIAGFYYVAFKGDIYTCKAKGIFRNMHIKPLVGDNVVFTPSTSTDDGSIRSILPRHHELIRPAVCNVDMVLIVMAAAKPEPALYQLDKYLVYLSMMKIPAAILFTKSDLDQNSTLDKYMEIYDNAGYKTLSVSVKAQTGVEELLRYIEGKTIVLAGPSGVGKSTLTNTLCPHADMATNSISRKIDRGKHTTRHSELFVVDEHTFLCDTPGFTSVNIDNCDISELRIYFPDIAKYEGKCRFKGCNHIAEPDCMVKDALEHNLLPQSRYDSYKKLYTELAGRKKY